MQTCVELGGTISGEHGIGLEKRQAMRMVFSEVDFTVQRGLKRAFDSENVLNPGKVIPPPEADAQAPIVRPVSGNGAAAEIMEGVKNAASRGQKVIPAGSGTYSQYGNLIAPDALHLASARLADVIEYDPPNQVITVGAGLALNALQEKLAAHNQWLPLRPPFFKADSTIGRLVALAASGPERLLYGGSRDLLLGLRFVNSAGNLIAAGGRVVKNVAGYDITRLITGSAGSLGFITEATWRVSTLPERCAAITAEGSLDACAATALEVLKSNCLPVFVVCLPVNSSTAKAGDTPWHISAGFEGFPQTVDYQLEKCSGMLQKGGLKVRQQFDYAVHQGAFGEIYEKLGRSPFILRGDFLLNRCAGFLRGLDDNLSMSHVFLDSGCGRILIGLQELGDEHWHRICSLAAQTDGHVLLEKAPDDFKKRNDVFGLPTAAWKIMHRIKAELDPDNLFAPGRLPGKV